MRTEKSNLCAVIMAGGVGSRFWPLSTSTKPKQFLDILGTGKTLIQQTYERMLLLCEKENIYVVTHTDYASLVKQQLKALSSDQILLEPSRKNTAPCIAYAAHKIHAKNPNSTLIVAPSDHLILNTEAFCESIRLANEKAQEQNRLITLGIQPSRPDTGYGYIQFIQDYPSEKVCAVKTFTEKPNDQLAKTFLESGDFYWNSGIFIWKTQSILHELQEHLPEMHQLFDSPDKYYSPEEPAFVNEVYAQCSNISIDYGVMEKAQNVYVVLSDFGWSDLGTWGSVYTHVSKDASNNALMTDSTQVYESSSNMIFSDQKDKLLVLHGIDNAIVVDTQKALLICNKNKEQSIKQIVNDLKIKHKDFI